MIRESYGTLFDRFWDGPTGREIQARGKDPVIVALYLFSNKHANMIGLYELPVVTIAHFLTCLGKTLTSRSRAVRRALEHLRNVEFAYFDEATSFVWVKEMARIRLQLEVNQRLKPEDNRLSLIHKLYATLPPNPLLGPFYSRYAQDLHLFVRRDVGGGSGGGLPPPSDGAPTEPRSPGGDQYQEQEQKQVPGPVPGPDTRDQEQRSGAVENGAPRAHPPVEIANNGLQSPLFDGPVPHHRHRLSREPAKDSNYRAVARQVREELREKPDAYASAVDPNLVEAVKARCGVHHIDYHPSGRQDVVEAAIASEWFKHEHPELVRS